MEGFVAGDREGRCDLQSLPHEKIPLRVATCSGAPLRTGHPPFARNEKGTASERAGKRRVQGF